MTLFAAVILLAVLSVIWQLVGVMLLIAGFVLSYYCPYDNDYDSYNGAVDYEIRQRADYADKEILEAVSDIAEVFGEVLTDSFKYSELQTRISFLPLAR